ncbi:MAG: ABC transporter ATP-binding protein [Christensenellales bacterium]|nr:MAG: ABC transporter [Oscillospiraceae bacterium]
MKRWFKYIRPHIVSFIVGPLCMIVEVVGEIMMPWLLRGVLNAGSAGTLTVGSCIGYMAAMILTALLMMAGGVGGAYFGTRASVGFSADLRLDLYKKVQSYSFANIDRFSSGSLVTRLTNDVTQLQNFINMLLRMCLRAPGMMIGALIMAVALRPDLSLVFCVSIPALFIAILFIVRRGFPRFKVVQERIDTLNSTVEESVTNVRVVKSFVREDHEEEKFRGANGALRRAGMAAYKIMIGIQPVMTICMNLTTVAVLWIGGRIVMREAGTVGGMQVGDLSSFVTYVTQILSSLMMVTMMFMMSSRAMASARRISEVLDELPDISDEGAAQPELRVEHGDVEFRDVSFRYYKGSSAEVLSHINLHIKAGSTVGIIGSTGCGKTTLVSLIPRLYDTDSGEVLVDGVNVRDYSLYHLREGVGMVLQKNVLFSGTIAENLRWGNADASDEEMLEASRAAEADKFVSSFPEGYETVLGQGGANVSGGQKQRLCIARALLKKPKIIILDDSTSAVDTATEARIREAFATSLAGTTKIIIAQRISSVRECDNIIVFGDGEIVGEGTHDELMSSCEDYRDIVRSQSGSAEKEARA